ncbi:MAG: tetratricopeptide repeat protein, partial [Planctomycetes bacterium]|nr:tetratricopeptide repeat protein [Planctomycetota bacterium]
MAGTLEVAVAWSALSLMAPAVTAGTAVQLPPTDPPPNLLFVSLDTTRADCFSAWGGNGDVAPAFDALAAEGLVAERAWAPTPLTFPSHASMFTGLYPFAHGVRDNDLYQLDADAPTVARALSAAGWRTEAIVASTVLRAATGLAHGFERYVDLDRRHAHNTLINIRRPAAEVSALAIERLAVADPRPWFLWLHYFDPHQPLVAPDTPRDAPLREQYDAQVRYVDREFARVIAALRESGALERTWIVVCGDHGEGLGIQLEATHSYLVEEGTLRIPLFVRPPDGGLRGRLAAPASAADVAPTLLAAAGLLPAGPMHGRDLVAAFAAEQADAAAADALADRTIWFETHAGFHTWGWRKLEGVVAGRFKYVRNVREELFEISDPRAPELERTNLARARPDVTKALAARMEALLAEPVGRLDSAVESLPPDEVARLMELGYIARSVGGEVAGDGDGDPREHYPQALQIEWALGEAAAGRFDGAIAALQGAVARRPDHALFRETLGKVLMQAGRPGEAAPQFRAALAREERLVAASFYLGVIEAKAGHADEALRLLRRTVELSPVHLEGWVQLRGLEGARRDYPAVLRASMHVLRLAVASATPESLALADQTLGTWLPNVLRRLAGDPGLAATLDAALALLGAGGDPRLA